MPITKWQCLVRDPDQLADVIREAFAIARSGRPGPVLIDIVKNVTAARWTSSRFPQRARLPRAAGGHAPPGQSRPEDP